MEKQLEQLTPLAQRAFAAALAQRMMPNFILFAELTEQSEAGHALQSALDTVWEKLLTPKAKINFEKQQLKLEELEPQPDDHDFFGVYPALDTCMAVLAVLAAMPMPRRLKKPLLRLSKPRLRPQHLLLKLARPWNSPA